MRISLRSLGQRNSPQNCRRWNPQRTVLEEYAYQTRTIEFEWYRSLSPQVLTTVMSRSRLQCSWHLLGRTILVLQFLGSYLLLLRLEVSCRPEVMGNLPSIASFTTECSMNWQLRRCRCQCSLSVLYTTFSIEIQFRISSREIHAIITDIILSHFQG
jgi:hypothetical protein